MRRLSKERRGYEEKEKMQEEDVPGNTATKARGSAAKKDKISTLLLFTSSFTSSNVCMRMAFLVQHSEL